MKKALTILMATLMIFGVCFVGSAAASPDSCPDYILELDFDSPTAGGIVYANTIINNYTRTGFFEVGTSGMGPNVILAPTLHRVVNCEPVLIGDNEIASITFYLCGNEYNTLAVGEFGEFDFWDIFNCHSLVIEFELSDSTIIEYSFTYDVFAIDPEGK